MIQIFIDVGAMPQVVIQSSKLKVTKVGIKIA